MSCRPDTDATALFQCVQLDLVILDWWHDVYSVYDVYGVDMVESAVA